MDTPATSELARAAGISKSYASEIATGARIPARPLAIRLYRETGWRHPCISSLTDADIDTLERIDPWIAPSERQAA